VIAITTAACHNKLSPELRPLGVKLVSLTHAIDKKGRDYFGGHAFPIYYLWVCGPELLHGRFRAVQPVGDSFLLHLLFDDSILQLFPFLGAHIRGITIGTHIVTSATGTPDEEIKQHPTHLVRRQENNYEA